MLILFNHSVIFNQINKHLTYVNYICAIKFGGKFMQLCSVKDSYFSEYIIHQIHRPYGKFYLFESYVVSEIEEGVVFGGMETLDIFTYLTEFYDGIKRPTQFVYISNRINSFAVKPVDWLNFAFMGAYMIGYCIVDDSSRARERASLEEKFVPSSFAVFNNLELAIRWSFAIYMNGKFR